MSYQILELAKRVGTVLLPAAADTEPVSREIWPSEIHILKQLAHEARDADDGWTQARGTAWLRADTKLSESGIRKAYAILVANGHITREVVAIGKAARTRVHPQLIPALKTHVMSTGVVPATLNPDPATHVTITGDPCNENMGLLKIEDSYIGVAHARAREDEGFEGRAGGPWDPLFDAWDAMAERAGLPGPITRDLPRRQTLLAKLQENGEAKVLAVIDAVGRSDFLVGRKRRGQGDWQAGFDWVMGVGELAKKRAFIRIVEGEFGPPITTRPAKPADSAPPAVVHAADPPGVDRLRAGLVAAIGAATCRNWIDPLEFSVEDGHLTVAAPSNFHRDWLHGNFRGAIERVATAIWGPVEVAIVVSVGKPMALERAYG